ncbi:MAG: DUF72 domain-containing protein [Thermodesulfobacteriota bacterium]
MIKVGCCGFPVRRSLYYRQFRIVEVQKTFYQIPKIETAKKWREEAPESFEFTMKAWQLITHEPTSPTYRRLGIILQEERKKNYGFFKGTEEVEEAWFQTETFANVLGVKKILFQTSHRFTPTEEHVRDLKNFIRKIHRDTLTLIWEPRGEWERGEVEKLCKDLGIFPCLDPFEAPLPKVTLLYLRLHGRTGFRYSYSKEEMVELINKVKEYPEADILFNNQKMYTDAIKFKKLL